ncbi:MAG: cation diffusion facilitator family transporter [Roseinatronobacter sp.]
MRDFSTDTQSAGPPEAWLGLSRSAFKLVVAIGSLLTTVVLTAGKLTVGLLSGSLALVADALQGLVDVVVTALTVGVVTVSDRGADASWTCGREKLEAVAALAEAVLLGIIAVFIWHLAGMKLVHGTTPMQIEAWYLVAAACAAGADFIRHLVVKRAARATGSMALDANAAHFLTDALGTVLVTLGLLGAWYGVPVADTLAAIGLAGLLSATAFTVGRRALAMLLDRLDPTQSRAALDAIGSVPEVVQVTRLHIRRLPDCHRVDLALDARLRALDDIARLEAILLARLEHVLGRTELCAALRPYAGP